MTHDFFPTLDNMSSSSRNIISDKIMIAAKSGRLSIHQMTR